MREPPTVDERAGVVIDARGRKVSQLDPVVLRLTRQATAIPPETLNHIADQVGRLTQRAARVGMWLSIACFACLGLILVINTAGVISGRLDRSEALRTMLPFAGAWIAPLWIWIGARAARHRQITKIMLAHQRCPHCGYDLRLLPRSEADRTTVCPECGCAWNMTESTKSN